MSKYSDRCGTCVFAKAYHDHKDEAEHTERITCVFGGTISGPYDADTKPCIAFVRRKFRSKPASNHVTPVAKCTADKPARSIVGVKDETVWTPQMDEYLKRMRSENLSIWNISTNLGVDRISIVNRIRALGLDITPKSRRKAADPLIDGNNLPLDQQQYPHVKCCKGQCCKYKETCQHHLHWLEMGRPQRRLINSVSSCINTSYGVNHAETSQTYFEYIGIDGSRKPDPITFAEACQ